MFTKNRFKALCGAALIASSAALSSPAFAVNEAMLDLLKILKDKGSLTQDEYELLVNASRADGEKAEGIKQEVKAEIKTAKKDSSWTEKIKIKGDTRFRYETRHQDPGGQNIDRFRVRARLGAYAQVNDEVKAGFRLASNNGTGSATSTNADLEDDFAPIGVDIDLAYLDWAPQFLSVANTNLLFGKFKQPWQKVNDMIWDGDTNPEGIGVKTKFKMNGFDLLPSFGYYSMNDVAGESVSEDAYLAHTQLAANIGKKNKLGISYYHFENAGGPTNGASANNEEHIVEVFGAAQIPGLPLPVTLFGSYAHNTNDNDELVGDDQDAYSIGVKSKYKNFKAAYEWRDVGINAVNASFDNSDFQDDSQGHIFKLGYAINKNFSFGTTYYVTERNTDDRERERLQVDLKAKF